MYKALIIILSLNAMYICNSAELALRVLSEQLSLLTTEVKASKKQLEKSQSKKDRIEEIIQRATSDEGMTEQLKNELKKFTEVEIKEIINRVEQELEDLKEELEDLNEAIEKLALKVSPTVTSDDLGKQREMRQEDINSLEKLKEELKKVLEIIIR